MLTIIFTTNNEAPNIGAALQSVLTIAQEIIIVDSFSTDNTTDIIRTYQQQYPFIRLLQREYKGPSDQKNWAIPQSQHQWVLILDADERVTPDLALEIQAIINDKNNDFDGYWIGRDNFFMGQPIRYSGWENDQVIRLIKRDNCRYDQKQVHEEIEQKGKKIGKLKQKMQHFTFRSMSHFLGKQERYALWSADDHAAKTPRVTYFHLLVKPLFRFFKHFILKKGFLDGKVGFVISSTAAWSVFLR